MTVEMWAVERVKPYPGNPRKRSKAAVTKLAASIREFGFRQPIVVDEFHPTQKPVALARRALLNSSESGNVVLDLFLGSGATLIAAQSEGRRCYGLEIEPRYCDTIVARWEKFTNQKAVLERNEAAA